VGTLGVIWNPGQDTLVLRSAPTWTNDKEPTKRLVLSHIARIFDPAGWAAPVILAAKILLQDLWKVALEWDQPFPEPLYSRWQQLAADMPKLINIQIPRWTGISIKRELHAFADASGKTYAAAVYLRGLSPSGEWMSSLLMAKTKVAPLRLTSIPRLELCGALLAARLLQKVADGLRFSEDAFYAWSDASVVLSWIRAHPSKWEPFVANRVAAIQDLGPARNWRYVVTTDNPADLATRGVSVKELDNNPLWWRGPPWMQSPMNKWETKHSVVTDTREEQRMYTVLVSQINHNEMLHRFSSFSRLIRVTAWCLRWLRRANQTKDLSTDELRRAALRWFSIVQQEYFAEEHTALSRRLQVSPSSRLSALRPFISADKLIRVGGRLANAPLSFAEKHPILLAKECHLSHLLVREAHALALHGGPQLTRSVLAKNYWILHANTLIRSEIKQCVRCAKSAEVTAQQ